LFAAGTDRRLSLDRVSGIRPLGAVGELVIACAAAAAAVAVCTALIYPLKHVAPVDSLGVVYVVAVLLTSATWGLPLGVITALGSVLAFDYFQLPPIGSLSIRHGSDWVALATFVIAATIGGQLARVVHSRSDLAASRARIIAAADTARERLARDLHDGTQQRLVTTVVNLQLADQQFDRDPQGARELLRAGLTEAGEALTELRELAHGVHPSILTNRGIGAAAAALAARSRLPVEVTAGDERYAPQVEAAAYFFIAEALTNVAKHAKATYAELSVQPRDGRLMIDVRDDGVGGADSTGSGIRGLRDRVEALGGQMQIVSPPGQGTHLHAAIAHSGTSHPDR
jgi:signal transduction histidine kinase